MRGVAEKQARAIDTRAFFVYSFDPNADDFVTHRDCTNAEKAVIQLLLLFFFAALAAPHVRTGFVTDEPGFMGADAAATLENTVAAFSDQTGFDVAVLVVAGIGGENPCAYATAVRKDWQLGGPDGNGVLYLVVPPPEKKTCISTGRGARAYLGDAAAVSIIDTVAKPLNLQNRRVEAVEAATAAIIRTLGPTPVAERVEAPQPAQPYVDRETATEEDPIPWILITIVVVIVIMLLYYVVFWGARGGYRRYGGYSGSSSTYFYSGSSYSSGHDSSSSSDSGGDGGGGGGGDSG